MGLSIIGTPAAAAGTTISIPAGHLPGDLMLIWAYRDGNATAPSLPATWTSPTNGSSGANSNSSRLGWKIATTAGSETSGTWTNATHLLVIVLRGYDLVSAAPVGSVTGSGASSSTVTYGAVTLTKPGGLSWVLGFAGHRSVDTNLQTPPTGMVNVVTFVDGTSELALHATNKGVSGRGYQGNWPSTDVSVGGTSLGWRSMVVEVFAAPINVVHYQSPCACVGNTGIISMNESIR